MVIRGSIQSMSAIFMKDTCRRFLTANLAGIGGLTLAVIEGLKRVAVARGTAVFDNNRVGIKLNRGSLNFIGDLEHRR